MTRIVYVNGLYKPYAQASVHCEDRGYQFGDAVYEVCEVRDGALIDERRHIDRLERSLRELSMQPVMPAEALGRIMRETIRRNRVRDGLVYLQVSRGVAPRNFLFPPAGTPLTLVCLARSVARADAERKAESGIKVVTELDPRWNRCDIKTVMLLPASLAKERARSKGAQEVWFVDAEGFVTEGGSSNAWIVTPDRALVTTPVTNAILRGVTRTTALEAAEAQGLRLEERRFTVAEAKSAHEAFITSATNIIMPVIAIDDTPVGNGAPGTVGRLLRQKFHDFAESSA